MLIHIFCFGLIAILIMLYVLLFQSISFLSREINLLPVRISNEMDLQPLKVNNTSLNEFFREQKVSLKMHTLISIFSTECSICKKQMNNLEDYSKFIRIPMIILIQNKFNKMDKFYYLNKEMDMINISEESLNNIGIDTFPTFLIVNKQGIVLHESNNLMSAVDYLESTKL